MFPPLLKEGQKVSPQKMVLTSATILLRTPGLPFSFKVNLNEVIIMMIVEALKKVKYLERKASDLRKLVSENCAKSTMETDKYTNQSSKISEWLQSHSDIIKEILYLRICIQKTNLVTSVSIELGGKIVKKSIAAWIHRRRNLAELEVLMQQCLTDRGIREGLGKGPSGDEVNIKIVRFYDPVDRDNKLELFVSEPSIIDGSLEVAAAITPLIED